jgi:cytochrome c
MYGGIAVLGAMWLAVASLPAGQADQQFGFGRLATEEEIERVDIDVRYDGKGLPAGTGTYAAGKILYLEQCASCHGSELEGNPEVAGSPLVGEGKTVERYWPYAPPLFDYIRRSMPVSAPGSLSNDQVYSLVAFILGEAGITPKELLVDAESLAQVEMPNRDGFIPDDRPDVP